ncbi:MAG: ACP S-malonyltransferase [Thermomicrobiales bacterium]
MGEVIDGTVALVFPGQGSQFVGMGRELLDASPAAKQVFTDAERILGVPLTELMFNGPGPELEDTINAQPAILTASYAALVAIRERVTAKNLTLTPAMVAGHSLGEFTALVAAGGLTFPDALALVRERGRLMKQAGEEVPGAMAAVLGVDDAVLAEVCAEASDAGVVVIANANCPGQTVISGEVAAIERAMALAKERGAKRAVRLGISIASHSPLMARASASFAECVAQTPLADPSVPVVANVTAALLTTAAEIRQELSVQIERPVNWTGSVQAMIAAGVDVFLEIGPGNVLAGLIKRINRDVHIRGISDLGLDLPAGVKAA